MADVRIDTRSLTYTQFLIPERNSELLEGADVPLISLEPGTYSFQQISSSSFKFEVTADGRIRYSAEHDGFLGGWRTDTLVVEGFSITLDGTRLSHGLHPTVEGMIVGFLSPEFPHPLTLIPAPDGYGFQAAAGVVAAPVFMGSQRIL
jgi:hypothetical protein